MAVDDASLKRGHSHTLCRIKWLQKRGREGEKKKRERNVLQGSWFFPSLFSFLFFSLLFFSFSFSRSLAVCLSLSPVRSSFQCRCWQQQQCSSSSHVNSEEYHHCSDLRNCELVFLSSLTNSLSVYDLRFSSCTYSPRCLSNEFLPCPVKLRPLRYPYHRKQPNPDAWLLRIYLTRPPKTQSQNASNGNEGERDRGDGLIFFVGRYGRVHSVRIDDQRYGFVAFLDVRTASKAHHAENILDEQRLRTAFHDGSTLVPKALLEPPPPPATTASSSSSSNASAEQPSPLTSTVLDPSSTFVSSPNTPTVTSSSTSKLLNGEREKRPSRTHASPDDNVR